MKILITVGIYPPDIGGPASFVPKIAKLLAENKHDVTVICLSDNKITDNEDYKVKRILRNQNLFNRWIKTIFTIIKNGKNVDCLFVNGLPMESYIANLFLRKKLVRKIVGDWAWERGRNKGIIEESFDDFQVNSHNFHLEIAKFSRGWTATKADLVITPSEHLSNVVNKWGVKRENLKIIYNGTKISNTSNKVKVDGKVLKFITVGRLAPWKNIDSIIKTMSILKNKNIDFELVVVGSGPLEKKLKNLVKSFELEEQITFTGQKTATELADYYKKAEIYVQASGYEGLPHVLLEAINYNLTLVSTPVGGSNEVLESGKNGWILELVDGVKPDPYNLFNIIIDIKNSNKSREIKLSNAKNLLKEKFNEDQNLIKYLEVFQS